MNGLVRWIERLVAELRRRRVIRVAVVYATTGFVLLQLADILVPALRLPSWTLRLVTLALVLGFPLAIGLAWVYNVTDEGLERVGEGDAAKTSPRRAPFNSNGLVVGLLIVAIGLLAYPRVASDGERDGDAPAAPSDTAAVTDRSIAVLPFKPLSGGDQTKTFARGIHDDLLTRLANISALKVISRTAVQPYRDTDLTTGQIADSLGVRWVMEGGVQVLQNQIQVNAQLIDPRSETHRWAEDYRRDLTAEDLFAIQGEITRKIADALEAQLTAGEQRRIAGAPTENLQAYRLYVKGRSNLNRRTPEGMVNAVKYFREAIRRDSSFALAWSGLADATGMFPAYGPDSLAAPDVDLERAARRALALDPDLAEAHASMGYLRYRETNVSAALPHLQRAITLKPNYAQAHHWLAISYLVIGQPVSAREHAERAVELDPQHSAARITLIALLLGEGNTEEAASQYRRLTPRLGAVGELTQGLVLYHGERWDALEEWARKQIRRESVRPWARFYLARIALRRGDTEAARNQLQELRAQEPPSLFFIGLVHAALGEHDEAFAAWEKKQIWQLSITGAVRYLYPDVLDALRADPRYDELVRDINRSWGVRPDGTIPKGKPPPTETAPEADA
jgi:TolB-like protein/lipopolysaccharide biosynthesis regulator YciM